MASPSTDHLQQAGPGRIARIEPMKAKPALVRKFPAKGAHRMNRLIQIIGSQANDLTDFDHGCALTQI